MQSSEQPARIAYLMTVRKPTSMLLRFRYSIHMLIDDKHRRAHGAENNSESPICSRDVCASSAIISVLQVEYCQQRH